MSYFADSLYLIVDVLFTLINQLYAFADILNTTDAQAIGWLLATLAAYYLALRLGQKSGGNPLLNPVLISAAIIIAGLYATGTSYDDYFAGGRFIHLMLGPATVALAIPLVTHMGKIKATALPAAIALVCGSATAIGSAIGITYLLGASPETMISMAPKSATAPIAMGISEISGGVPAFTAVLAISTGILGAVFGKQILDLLGIRDWQVVGFSIGVSSHGIGTARAFQLNEVAGTFAGIAMGLNGLLTAVLVPVFLGLL